ncbi:transposase [Vibrio crassostreae]|uniref:Uncharacterized protein n=1 Tax=Vibrio crassostreae TaxID=246167 RepID=A0A822MQB1_9VIBR|nr:transposase [Vibrio crassostreae]CAK2231633.1 transposase [Vibrio crassostreae]CAK2586865.1 transposase [Vibrio crassostreae]CDT12760.1 hypothetical protein VCR5J5_1490013 [Vibrio crassostreae]
MLIIASLIPVRESPLHELNDWVKREMKEFLLCSGQLKGG